MLYGGKVKAHTGAAHLGAIDKEFRAKCASLQPTITVVIPINGALEHIGGDIVQIACAI